MFRFNTSRKTPGHSLKVIKCGAIKMSESTSRIGWFYDGICWTNEQFQVKTGERKSLKTGLFLD